MKTRALIFFSIVILIFLNLSGCTSFNLSDAGKEISVIIKKSTVSSPHILHKIREDLVFKKYVKSVAFLNIPEPVIQIEMEAGAVRSAELDYGDIKRAILKEFKRVPFMETNDRSVILIRKKGFEPIVKKENPGRIGNIIVSKGEPFTRLNDIAQIKFTFRHKDERFLGVPVYKLKISYVIEKKKMVYDDLARYEKLYGLETRIIDSD